MPRGKAPKIMFGKSHKSPSQRKQAKAPNSFKMPMNKPKGEREITRFVDEARADGESSASAIRQFQEAECDHPRYTEIANGPSKKVSKCVECGHLKTVEKAA